MVVKLLLVHIGCIILHNMTEMPQFDGFTPEDVAFLNELDKSWNEPTFEELYEQQPFESYRLSYLRTIMDRRDAIDNYMKDRSNPYRMMMMDHQDRVTHTHFLYYMDNLFAANSSIDRVDYIVEAFGMADMSQKQLNIAEGQGVNRREAVELRTRIAEILLADSDDKAKQDIIDMYTADTSDVVNRFIIHREHGA